jgi:hypothetical protein
MSPAGASALVPKSSLTGMYGVQPVTIDGKRTRANKARMAIRSIY